MNRQCSQLSLTPRGLPSAKADTINMKTEYHAGHKREGTTYQTVEQIRRVFGDN